MVIKIYPVFVCKTKGGTKRGTHQSLISFINMLRLYNDVTRWSR